MSLNGVILQGFEWNTPIDGGHWQRLANQAPELSKLGFTAIWLPPVSKGGAGIYDVGYGIYDAWDLGEFHQKGTVRTKYGTKDQLINATRAFKRANLEIYADIVLNHRMGGDDKELFKAIQVDQYYRLRDLSYPHDIEAWTKFDFPGRNGSYSKLKLNFNHITGIDYDDLAHQPGVFRVMGDNKYWSMEVDNELGNYDYLMAADLNLNHPDVIKDIQDWLTWLTTTLNLSGVRIDAAKHIDRTFLRNLLTLMKSKRDFFAVAEYWKPDTPALQDYIRQMGRTTSLFDVTLHFKLQRASAIGRDFDLRTIFDGTLTHHDPLLSVTFVDNHDTQPGQSFNSWIETWFKPHAYSLILLRSQGYPCVFYGDLYGTNPPYPQPAIPELPLLLNARHHYAYGPQSDYFDHANTIGWVRHGTPHHPRSGLAVLISTGTEGWKFMHVGPQFANTIWLNSLPTYNLPITHNVTIDSQGNGKFYVQGGKVAVYHPIPL